MSYTLDSQTEIRVREALRAVAEAEEICRRAMQAGIDVQAQDLACQYYRQRLEAVLQHLGSARRE